MAISYNKLPDCVLDQVKLDDIVGLINIFGKDISLGMIEEKLKTYRPYTCPKCHGKGYIEEIYNAYPSGLPDSGWAYEEGVRKINCDLCSSTGRTKVKYRPHMVQDGFEEDV